MNKKQMVEELNRRLNVLKKSKGAPEGPDFWKTVGKIRAYSSFKEWLEEKDKKKGGCCVKKSDQVFDVV